MLFSVVNAVATFATNAEAGPPLDFVRAAKRGDERAWAVLFRHYQPALTAYCLACAGGRRDAALDLTQDVFALAISNVHQLSDEQRFQGWLFTLARNHCLRVGHRSATEEAALARLSLLVCDEPPDQAAQKEAWLTQLEAAAAALENPLQREIVSAHYGRGEKTRDIAARLSTPHGTVTVALMRFRQAVKRALLDELTDGGAP